jgi:hypothetical protein
MYNNDHGKQCLWILLLVALVITVLVASATTLVPMSFANLAQRSTAIVRVRCLSTQSVWADGEIWTDTRFEILRQEKTDAFGTDQVQSGVAGVASENGGAAIGPAHTITLRQMGGAIGGLHSHVADVPEFHTGEEAYLFLWRRAGEPYRVLGWSQGTFRVSRDTRTGAERVTQDSALASFHPETREFQTSGVRNLPVATFEEKLRQAVNAGKN